MTFFDEMNKSFKDVPITDGKISTAEFLEASESLVKLFGMLLTDNLHCGLIKFYIDILTNYIIFLKYFFHI